MEYYIYGKNEYGNNAKKIIEDEYNGTVIGFLDSFHERFSENEITNIDDVGLDAVIVIAVQKPQSALEINNLLRKKGFSRVFWFGNLSGCCKTKKSFLEDMCFETAKWDGFSVLPHLEVHISDKCNLNCRGCTHFSPLFQDIGVDFDKQIGGLKRLKKIGITVGRIDILGGEPFLNDRLGEYIEVIRNLFPDSFIDVFSNGLLIPKMSDELFSIFEKNRISLSVTEYPPTRKIMDRIKEKLEGNHILYRIIKNENRTIFNIPLSTSSNSKYPRLCISDGCVAVNNGLIARCPTLMYLPKLNKAFGLNLPEDGIFEISSFTDGEKLMKKLKERVPLCDHCIKYDINWGVCGKMIKPEDFVVTE